MYIFSFKTVRYCFMRYLLYFSSVVVLLPLSAFSQKFFNDVQPTEALSARLSLPERCRLVRFDARGLAEALAEAPERFSVQRGSAMPELALPLPDGQWKRFRVMASPVMAEALQAKYPDIRCYTGVGIDDPTASLKCELTPRGFSAMILSARHSPVFLDPLLANEQAYAVAYFKADSKHREAWTCLASDEVPVRDRFEQNAPELSGDCQLRRYRLALACTGEYAQFHGGTKPLALSAMSTTLNRINGVYERDLGITMALVPNNDTLIFLDPATDGYSNNDIFAMLVQNVTKCNTLIGPNNYDIGHVLATASGGAASLGVACNNSTKARGATGSSTPVGDAFDIDLVAHEIGHQLGANHTQNNNCSRNNATAVEPGSGSTIMSYAGICSPDVQDQSDDYFHAISLQEIRQYTTAGLGNTCPQKLDLGNSSPEVFVVGGTSFVIPHSTPFVLTAAGADQDNYTLTYCWEQMDNQAALMPPRPTNTGGPMFRSLPPMTSPERYFPALRYVLSNTTATWERLPSVGRSLHFRVTARDHHLGGGCTAFADVNVAVAPNAGPFAVVEPNTPTVWYAGETQTVRWNVAGTDTSPVQCAEVLLLLSTDGGWTYPHLLSGPVPNTGEAQVEVPALVSDSCRVRVQAVGNLFFDVSDQDFRIALPPTPAFLLQISLPNTAHYCAGDSLVFWAHTLSLAGYDKAVTLQVDGLPSGAEMSVWPNPLPVGDSARIVVKGLQPGEYDLVIRATSDTLTRQRSLTVRVITDEPSSVALRMPVDGQRGVAAGSAFSWAPVADASLYRVQLSLDPAFASSVWETTTSDTTLRISNLQPEAVYYWRVRAENACGQGPFSEVWAFQGARKVCGFEAESADVPVAISAGAPSTVSSLLSLAETRLLADVDVWLNVRHTWVGDVRAQLIGPMGTAALLFDRPGVPALSSTGCGGDDLALTFDDDALLTAAHLENTCNSQPPALSGVFQPVEALERFNLQPAAGTWRLELSDLEEEDGGALEAWGMRCCFWDSLQAAALANNELLVVPAGQQRPVGSDLLALELGGAAPEEGLFTLLSLPLHGQVLRHGSPLGVGAVFSQADIDAGAIAYAHNGNAATKDAFALDARHAATGQWLHGVVFRVQIVQNDLVVALTLLDSLRCHNDTSARIEATVKGGKPPYTYRLAGSATEQDNGLFEGLAAGTYAVVVTDGWGFTAESPAVVVPNPDSIALWAYSSNDSVFVAASGGRAPYRYRLLGGDYQDEPLFAPLSNGSYWVEVQDALGCTATTLVWVYVGPLVVLEVQATDVRCFGGADGSVRIVVGGGVPPYAYSLNGTDFQAEDSFFKLSAGQYLAVVRDKNGATAEQVFALKEPPVLQVSVEVMLNRIEVNAWGGTGGLEYSLDGLSFQSSPVFGSLPNGTYTVTVRDANGCTAKASAVVEVPPLQVGAVEVEGVIRCAGETVRLVVSVVGGVPPYVYALNQGPFQPDSLWEGVGSGLYWIEVRDAAGNVAKSDTVLIEAPAQLEAAVRVVGPHAFLAAVGGTPPYLYALNGSSWTSDTAFFNLPIGSHIVVVADANGCTDTVLFGIAYSPPLALVTRWPPTCAGASDGAFAIEILGGAPPFYCDGQLLSDSRCSREGLKAGQYVVTIEDAAGRVLSVTVTLEDPPVLSVSAEAKRDTLVAMATGGTGALEYSLNGLDFQPSPIFVGLPNGTYTVVVRDANGCTAVSVPVLIDVVSVGTSPPLPSVAVYPNPNSGHFWIRWPEPVGGRWQLALYDGQGALIRQLSYLPEESTSLWEVTLAPIPSGFYVLVVQSDRYQHVMRLFIASSGP